MKLDELIKSGVVVETPTEYICYGYHISKLLDFEKTITELLLQEREGENIEFRRTLGKESWLRLNFGWNWRLEENPT